MASIVSGFHCIGFSDDINPGNSWVVQSTEVDGRRYVECTRTNAAFERLVGKQFHMLDYLIPLRNQATERLMQIKEAENDPSIDLDDGDVELPPLKRARKELIDEVSSSVVVKGTHSNGIEFSVRVLTAASPRAKLSILLEPNAIQLLKMRPDQEDHSESFRPDISSFPDVKWQPKRHSLTRRARSIRRRARSPEARMRRPMQS